MDTYIYVCIYIYVYVEREREMADQADQSRPPGHPPSHILTTHPRLRQYAVYRRLMWDAGMRFSIRTSNVR